MIDAARRYNRVVQAGTQRRSGAVLAKAVQFLRDGGLGKLYAGKTVIYRSRDPIGVAQDSPVPSGVNYDLWLGPAPVRPFRTDTEFPPSLTTYACSPSAAKATLCGCLPTRNGPVRRRVDASIRSSPKAASR